MHESFRKFAKWSSDAVGSAEGGLGGGAAVAEAGGFGFALPGDGRDDSGAVRDPADHLVLGVHDKNVAGFRVVRNFLRAIEGGFQGLSAVAGVSFLSGAGEADLKNSIIAR